MAAGCLSFTKLAQAPRRFKDVISTGRRGDGCGKPLAQPLSLGATIRIIRRPRKHILQITLAHPQQPRSRPLPVQRAFGQRAGPPPAVNRTAGRSRLPSRNCTSTAILDLTKGIFTMLEANSRRLRRHRASTCSPTRYSPLRRRRRTFRADHLIMLAPYRFAAKNPEPLCYVRMCSNAATVRSENGAGGTHRVQRHRLHQIPIEDR